MVKLLEHFSDAGVLRMVVPHHGRNIKTRVLGARPADTVSVWIAAILIPFS